MRYEQKAALQDGNKARMYEERYKKWRKKKTKEMYEEKKKQINWQEIGKLFDDDTLTELTMSIEADILNKVCKEDNKNMQFIIPYDDACIQYGVEHNPPNSWNLHDVIRNNLAKLFNISEEINEI